MTDRRRRHEPEVQAELLAAFPEPDILVNNNGGPPRRDFRELDREAILEGVIQNMVTPIELIHAVIDGMAARGFGRIVNITSLSVYAPIPGPRSFLRRARRADRLPRRRRPQGRRHERHHQQYPAGQIDTDRLRSSMKKMAELQNVDIETAKRNRMNSVPAGRLGQPDEFGKLCAFLASEHAGYITGQNILIDGGAFRTAF